MEAKPAFGPPSCLIVFQHPTHPAAMSRRFFLFVAAVVKARPPSTGRSRSRSVGFPHAAAVSEDCHCALDAFGGTFAHVVAFSPSVPCGRPMPQLRGAGLARLRCSLTFDHPGTHEETFRILKPSLALNHASLERLISPGSVCGLADPHGRGPLDSGSRAPTELGEGVFGGRLCF